MTTSERESQEEGEKSEDKRGKKKNLCGRVHGLKQNHQDTYLYTEIRHDYRKMHVKY